MVDLRWVWIAPPCKSFSPLRDLDSKGPLRPKEDVEGDDHDREEDLQLVEIIHSGSLGGRVGPEWSS